jgi:acetoin utilization protein AcuB
MPTVHRYMTFDPYTVSPTDTMSAAHHLMRVHSIRHLPVIENGRLLGILSDRDLRLVHGASADPHETTVAQAMTKTVLAVTPDTPLDEAVQLMSTSRCGSLIVMGKTGVVGILTATDALVALTELLRREAA